MQNDTLAAVDIAKKIFEVGISDRPGHVGLRRRLPRATFLGEEIAALSTRGTRTPSSATPRASHPVATCPASSA